jgi:murein DD-endopeptidase MepM/ murein hydrolase activator NlpD
MMFVTSPTPVLDVASVPSNVGQATPITIHVQAKRGVRSASAFIEQNGNRYSLWQLAQPTNQPDNAFSFVAGTKTAPQLQDGDAKLIVQATANGRFKKSVEWQRNVTVLTHPPTVTVDSEQHYLYLGMAELATFSVGGKYTEAGVRVGNQTFRAWPMPGGKPGMFSLFAFAWNMTPDSIPVVYAANGVGNDVTSPLTVQFPKKEQPRYTIHDLQIDDRFMQKVVGELDPNGSGDLVTRFVKINNEMRRANNKTLSDLRLKTQEKFLWSQPFLRQAAKTEATFADQRKYMYKGQKIDEQVHLGYDLASTQHDGVQASNNGQVVYAAPLGIYGNCIVVDHGYGLQTIYGHLSRIDVKEGDAVKRGQIMGLTGATGMAGGDHLHFSMQLDGVQIDPKEWWDPHWIQDHIAKRVDLPGFSK